MAKHARQHRAPTGGKHYDAHRAGAMRRGIESITLFPTSPNIRLGSMADDWRAVGADIRVAMQNFEKA